MSTIRRATGLRVHLAATPAWDSGVTRFMHQSREDGGCVAGLVVEHMSVDTQGDGRVGVPEPACHNMHRHTCLPALSSSVAWRWRRGSVTGDLPGLPPCARRHPVRRKSARGPASPDPHQRLPTHLRRSAQRRQRLPSPAATLAQFPWYSCMLPLMKRGALARWSIRLRGTASTGGTSATTAIREIRSRRVLIPELDNGHVGAPRGRATAGGVPQRAFPGGYPRLFPHSIPRQAELAAYFL